MEYPNPKIKFYKVRTFNEKFTVTFDFIRENWKFLLKFSFYLILPICLFQSFAMNSTMKYFYALGYNVGAGNSGFDAYTIIMKYCLLLLFVLLGTCVLNAMVYSLMNEYHRRDSRLMTITLQDFRQSLIKNFIKLIRAYLFFAGMVIMVSMLFVGFVSLFASDALLRTGIIVVLMIAVLAGTLFLIVPLNLFMPIYLFEDISFSEAVRKSFSYGFTYWGETFVLVLVFSFLANIISGVTMTPWYIVTVLGEVFLLTEQNAEISSSVWYQFVVYLLGIIQSYGTYLSSMLTAIGIAFHYFHLREKKEGISVDTNIQNFDRL